jgi:hypothetical protein
MKDPPLFDDVIWIQAARARDLRAFTHDDAPSVVPGFATLREALGAEVPLDEATSKHWLHGRVREREILLRRFGATTGCSVDVAIDPPLRLGLRMEPLGQQVTLGPPSLADLFSVRSHDGRLAAALFESSDEGRALAAKLRSLQLAFPPAYPRVTDSLLSIDSSSTPQGAQDFLATLDLALDMVTQLEAARAALARAPWEQALERNFKKVAQRLGASLDSVRMALEGELDGVPVEAAAPMVDQAIHTLVRARLDPPLGLGLRVDRERSFAALRSLVGRGDIRTGDAAFDAAFQVTGSPEGGVIAALGEKIRAGLLAARAEGAEAVVTDEEVELTFPREMKSAEELDAVIGAAVAIARVFRPVTVTGSPYR